MKRIFVMQRPYFTSDSYHLDGQRQKNKEAILTPTTSKFPFLLQGRMAIRPYNS
ncbi:MAG: hypothetical protein F6K22_23950 [Okeania sp. SIO2F4]|uniref:hypothetical protein n=1 Tax=Okeania sp. SIO2F4 TaxID=2607790 RepID=UPI00142B8A24|nr:hypothetical protein [Okeania sp. SIO2F4]NES05591.1 hypothetical protein [Okeania sp. SIO2F4]